MRFNDTNLTLYFPNLALLSCGNAYCRSAFLSAINEDNDEVLITIYRLFYILGPGLVFVVIPEAIAHMPGSTFWAIIFFIFIFTVGVDSQVNMWLSVSSRLHHINYIHDLKRLECPASSVVVIIIILKG